MTIGRTIFLTTLGVLTLAGIRQGMAEPTQGPPIPLEALIPDRAQEATLSVAESSSCVVLDQIDRAMTLLSSATPAIGKKKYSWTETRNESRKRYSDWEKEFTLAVLRTQTCDIDVITITKRGDKLIAPEGWDIAVVERQSGIRWNNWNTEFAVKTPPGGVVIGNVEPFKKTDNAARRIRTAEGLWKVVETTTRGVEFRMYVPYSRDLHTGELVDAGRNYIDGVVSAAFDELRAKEVKSRTLPGMLVADIPGFTHGMFTRLPLIEHMDMGEFAVEPERTVERVYVLLGSNQERSFTYTCSTASACGAFQFTDNGTRRNPGTYSMIRQRYPEAELIKDFRSGAAHHVNVAKAAILLHENNLALLLNEFGDGILKDARLEEYLAAMYNASPKHILSALRASFKKKSADWSDHLPRRIRSETGGYIVKVRFLLDQELQQSKKTEPGT